MDIWIVSGDIMNNATINIYVQDFFVDMIFSWVFILSKNRVGWAKHWGSYGNTMFNYSRACQTVFHSSCPVTFPSALYEGSDLFLSSPTCVIIWLFDDSRPSGCEAVFHCGFNLHFSGANDVEHLFMCFWPFANLWSNVVSDLLSILIIYFYPNSFIEMYVTHIVGGAIKCTF